MLMNKRNTVSKKGNIWHRVYSDRALYLLLLPSFIIMFIFTYLYWAEGRAHMCGGQWTTQDNWSLLPLCGSEDSNSVLRLGGKPLYPLSHLASHPMFCYHLLLCVSLLK